MFKNNIKDSDLQAMYLIINEINYKHPLWWQVFLEDIILKRDITYINYTTLIISVYELEINNAVILYQILKLFKKYRIVTKVINKGEFVIIHLKNLKVMNYFTSQTKWINLIVYEYLSKEYSLNNLILAPNESESLRFIYQGTVYHFFTEPSQELKSNKYHKYTYLYKDLYIKHLGFLDSKLKYLRNRDEFLKNFKEYLENTN